MNLGTYQISNKLIVFGGLVLISLAIFIYLSIPSPKPPNPIPLITDTQAQLQKQYEAQLKAKDISIRDYQSRLAVSQERATMWANKYSTLQKEKENVKPPVTNAETRDRFISLGFTPLPVK